MEFRKFPPTPSAKAGIMLSRELWPLNLRHLSYFLAAAQYQNVTRAAEALHISQPALSKQIALLEQQIGVTLFLRQGRSFSLTEAGRVLAVEGRKFLSYEEELLRKVQDAAQKTARTVNLGYVGAVESYGLPALIQRFQAGSGGRSLVIHRFDRAELLSCLRAGTVDAALLLRLGGDDGALVYRDICSLPLCLVTSARHPLAARDHVALKRLKGEQILLRDGESVITNYFLDQCRINHFYPSITKHPEIMESIFLMVQAGLGVTITANHISTLAAMELHSTVLSDVPDIPLSLVWAHGREKPGIAPLLQAARETGWIPAVLPQT